MKNLYNKILIFSAMFLIFSCGNDDLEPTLAMAKSSETGIQDAADLESVLNGAYDRMSSSSYYARAMIINGATRSDNFYPASTSGRNYASSMDFSSNGYGPWGTIYGVIAICNIVIQADHASLEGSQTAISQTVGEAYALRALAHFDLLREYGQHFITGQGGSSALGVPYVKTYRDAANLTPARGTVESNVGDIVADLQQGISMMNASETNAEYMNIGAAYAILARAALYYGSVDSSYYSAAGSAAKWVLDNWGAKAAVGPAGYMASWYTDNAINSLFELAASGTDNAGINGMANTYRGTTYGDIRVVEGSGAPDVHAIYEASDIRYEINGMLGLAQGKYSVLGKWPSMDFTDNNKVIRVEEMHLIYAEALLRSGDSSGALTYLNNVPGIRGASPYTEATIENIMLERRKEFFGEGLRFYDLSRGGYDMPLVDSFKQSYDDLTGTPPAYGSYRYAFPISLSERNANPNIVQNYGY